MDDNGLPRLKERQRNRRLWLYDHRPSSDERWVTILVACELFIPRMDCPLLRCSGCIMVIARLSLTYPASVFYYIPSDSWVVRCKVHRSRNMVVNGEPVTVTVTVTVHQ